MPLKRKKQNQTELRLGGAKRSANNSAAVAATCKVDRFGLGLGLGLILTPTRTRDRTGCGVRPGASLERVACQPCGVWYLRIY